MENVRFVNVYADSLDQQWEHQKPNPYWCRGKFESQCPVHQGLEVLVDQIDKTRKATTQHYITDEMLNEVRSEITPETCWELIGAPTELEEQARSYRNECRIQAPKQVGFHIRRGDLAWFNWEKNKRWKIRCPSRQSTIVPGCKTT